MNVKLTMSDIEHCLVVWLEHMKDEYVIYDREQVCEVERSAANDVDVSYPLNDEETSLQMAGERVSMNDSLYGGHDVFVKQVTCVV